MKYRYSCIFFNIIHSFIILEVFNLIIFVNLVHILKNVLSVLLIFILDLIRERVSFYIIRLNIYIKNNK